MKTYIVASSKPWHKAGFDLFLDSGIDGNWIFVEDKVSLARAINLEKPQYVFFLHWNWKVGDDVTNSIECICFHMTDLPFGRGGSPLQNLIQLGISETKLTCLRMIGELDGGPIYCKRDLSLDGRAEDIYLRAASLCWEIIDWMVKNEPIPSPQVGKVTLFKRRTPEQSLIPPDLSLIQFYDFIRMLDAPTYPLAFLTHGDKTIEFSNAILTEDGVVAKVRICKL